jgi:hypothetical protein
MIKNFGFPGEETLLSHHRQALSVAASPCPTLSYRKPHPFNALEVVFSTTGDLIRVHCYDDRCSAPWNACLTSGYLESDRGGGTAVAIRREERAWLNSIRTLASEWLIATEADDRSWMARVATRIQRFDDRSDGLIDLVVVWPLDRRW